MPVSLQQQFKVFSPYCRLFCSVPFTTGRFLFRVSCHYPKKHDVTSFIFLFLDVSLPAYYLRNQLRVTNVFKIVVYTYNQMKHNSS
jgi:hypothetical protein